MFGFQRFGLRPDLVTLSKGDEQWIYSGGSRLREPGDGKALPGEEGDSVPSVHSEPESGGPWRRLSRPWSSIRKKYWNGSGNPAASGKLCLEPLKGFSCVRDIRICGLMIAIDLADEQGDPLPLDRLMELIGVIGKNGVLSGDSHIDGVLSCVLLFPALHGGPAADPQMRGGHQKVCSGTVSGSMTPCPDVTEM